MENQVLFSQSATPVVPLAGADYVPDRDECRIITQLDRILVIVIDGEWRTIEKLVAILRKRYPGVRFPENSVQAQLRNLRKIGYRVERDSIGRGLYQYRVLEPVNPGVGEALRKEAVN